MTDKQFGHLHPLTWTTREMVTIFRELGFSIVTGPEVETAEYNFDRLNMPLDHPARDMQDTLWLTDGRVMRTHTSPVQIRALERMRPPLRIIAPGRVFRNERTDATHEVSFYQLEGLAIDRDISLANLFGVLETFAKKFFGPETKVRFRPSYFPYTEPSLEMLVHWRGNWMEMMGAGMVHPKVIREMELDPNEWSGFAFGMGITRFMMVKYGITDIRATYSGDFRLLKQF